MDLRSIGTWETWTVIISVLVEETNIYRTNRTINGYRLALSESSHPYSIVSPVGFGMGFLNSVPAANVEEEFTISVLLVNVKCVSNLDAPVKVKLSDGNCKPHPAQVM